MNDQRSQGIQKGTRQSPGSGEEAVSSADEREPTILDPDLDSDGRPLFEPLRGASDESDEENDDGSEDEELAGSIESTGDRVNRAASANAPSGNRSAQQQRPIQSRTEGVRVRQGMDDGGSGRSAPPRSFDRRRPAANVLDVLGEDLIERALVSNPRLRSHLAGKILFKLDNNPEQFLFDWSGDKPEISKVASSGSEPQNDCVISVSEQNLLQVANGDLNPQIGMLSDKIHIAGRLSLAIYFFNLIAPSNGH